MKLFKLHNIFFLCVFISISCANEPEEGTPAYSPTPLDLEIPEIFKQKLIAPVIPSNNPQTVEGVHLGKTLFFDTALSGNNTQSCATCHNPENSFSDTTDFSEGIDGINGTRNTMP